MPATVAQHGNIRKLGGVEFSAARAVGTAGKAKDGTQRPDARQPARQGWQQRWISGCGSRSWVNYSHLIGICQGLAMRPRTQRILRAANRKGRKSRLVFLHLNPRVYDGELRNCLIRPKTHGFRIITYRAPRVPLLNNGSLPLSIAHLNFDYK